MYIYIYIYVHSISLSLYLSLSLYIYIYIYDTHISYNSSICISILVADGPVGEDVVPAARAGPVSLLALST